MIWKNERLMKMCKFIDIVLCLGSDSMHICFILIITYLSRASFAAGDSGTTNKTWIGSVVRWELESLEPPTMENPQLAFSRLWSITVFGYWRFRGSFCQYIQLGIKLEAPKEVSGPSITPNITWSLLMVAFKVVTAWEWVNPHKLVSSTDNNKSPFYKNKIKNDKLIL